MSSTPNYEVPAEMRDFAEKSVDQARKAFESFVGAARKTADTMQGSAEVARSSAQSVSARGFEYAEQNAAFDFAKKLVRTKDMQEAVQLQAEFVRSQFAAMQSQAKDMGSMASSAIQQNAESAKTAMTQGMETARQAASDAKDATHN